MVCIISCVFNPMHSKSDSHLPLELPGVPYKCGLQMIWIPLIFYSLCCHHVSKIIRPLEKAKKISLKYSYPEHLKHPFRWDTSRQGESLLECNVLKHHFVQKD